MIVNYKVFLNYKIILKSILYLFLGFFLSFIELLSIGSIPILIGVLVNKNEFFEKFPLFPYKDQILNLDLNTSIFYSIFIISTIFLFKNIYIVFLALFKKYIQIDIILLNTRKFLSNYLNSNYQLFLKKNPALIQRNIDHLMQTVANYFFSFYEILIDILTLILVISLILITSVTVDSFYLLLALFLIAFSIYYFSSSKIKKKSIDIQDITFKKIKSINQATGAIKEAKITGSEKSVLENFIFLVKNYEAKQIFLIIYNLLPRALIEIAAVAGLMILIYIYLLEGFSIFQILPILTLYAVSIIRVVPLLSKVTTSAGNMKNEIQSVNILKKELRELSSYKERATKTKYVKIFKKLKIQNLSFRYEAQNTNDRVFHNLNLEIKGNSKIAITGPSGCGKSTLVETIIGILKKTSGKIFLNGKDIKNDKLYKILKIGYVPQTPYIFDDTIINNIKFKNSKLKINSENIKKALEIVELSNFIKKLENGIYTNVGSLGSKLSGGQKQRLALARAILQKPKILILDEATSALDMKTEKKILENIFQELKDDSIIFITHKKSLLKKFDKVFNF